ncbi:MAG: ATP-binding protein [Nanobdellota archaeon]
MLTRKIYDTLLGEKKEREISIIIGPRQVGKTTLLHQVYDECKTDNNALFLDLDIASNAFKLESYEQIISTLQLHGYEKDQEETFYLFLDEFQRYGDITKIMKNLYDNHKNIKIYATGSSSLQIKNNVQESLAGRKIIHNLHPLSFEEFLKFKGDKDAINKYQNIKKLAGENIQFPPLEKYLEEFLIFGGYPAVVLAKTREEKIKRLNNIFDLYVKKELVEYLAINKIIGVKKVIEYLAINNGHKIKYEEVADRCNLTTYEVKQFIEVLNETYITTELRPFYTNKNKELVKTPKIYFIDNGVRNYFINNFNKTGIRSDTGLLFEGYIISELLKEKIHQLKYWQDKQKHEVDLIIDEISSIRAIEIKYKKRPKREDYRQLERFIKEYPQARTTLLNTGTQLQEDKIQTIIALNLGKYFDRE